MLYCRTYETEIIVVHPFNNPDESHFIEIEKDGSTPTFSVTCCCGEDWCWNFIYTKRNYDLIKYYIMDCIRECDDIDEVIDTLDEIFEENFMDIVCNFDEDDCAFADCDGNCDDCDCCGC